MKKYNKFLFLIIPVLFVLINSVTEARETFSGYSNNVNNTRQTQETSFLSWLTNIFSNKQVSITDNTATVVQSGIVNTKSNINTQTQSAFNQISSLNSDIVKMNALYKETKLLDDKSKINKDLIKKAKERKVFIKKLLVTNPLLFLSQAIPTKTKALLSMGVQNEIETLKVITGTVDVIYIDDFKNPKNSYYKYFLTINGKRYNLYPISNLNIKSNTNIQANGYILDNNIVIDTNNNNVKVIKSVAKDNIPLDSVGNQRTLVILLKNTVSEPEYFTTQEIYNMVFNGGMQRFMQEQSYGKVSFSGDVFGWYTLGHSLDCYNGSDIFPTSAELYNIVNTYHINLQNYDRIVYLNKDASGGCSSIGKGQHIINNQIYNFSTAIIGLGRYYDNINPNMPFLWTSFDSVLSHELGHSLGVSHANGWDCGNQILYGDCQHIEYGNYFDNMGLSIFSLNFNALYKEILGWVPDRVISISQSGTYFINPLELNSGFVVAKINILGTSIIPYYLEYRKGIGSDSMLNGTTWDGQSLAKNKEGLFVNIINTDNNFPFSRLLDMHPTSLDWYGDLAEQATLNFSTSTDSRIFNDQGHGITIGPILEVSSSSISFYIDLKQPSCSRFKPAVNYDYSPSVSAGSQGYIQFTITNQDYYGCGPSDFNVSLISPKWQSTIYPIEDISIAPNKTGYKTLTYDIPINTPPSEYKITFNTINRTTGISITKTVVISITEPLTITDIKPTFGPVGTTVTIIGTGFNPEENAIVLSGENVWSDLQRISLSNGKISYIIPAIVNTCIDIDCHTIPTPDGDYTIYISSAESSVGVNFHVGKIISEPSITVSTPNGGETLTMNSNYLINWSSPKSGSFKVDIKLSSESRDFTIAQGFTGNSYNWTVGSIIEKLILPMGQYKIKICESGTENCDSSNNYFTITSPTKPTQATSTTKYNPVADIVATDSTPPTIFQGSPSGSTLPYNPTVILSVRTDEASNCRYGDQDTSYQSLPNAFSTGAGVAHSAVVVGRSFQPGQHTYYVRCQDQSSARNTNTTSYPISFNVTSNQPTINITYPNNSGITVNAGSSMNITWNSTNMSSAIIFIILIDSNYDETYITGTGIRDNPGSYNWTIPNTLTPGQYKIKVVGVMEGIVGGQPETESAEFFNVTGPVSKIQTYKFHLFQTGSILDAIRSLFR